MKEMVGGCCVCSDERGWQENPLVYCDGTECNVAVHQACYGIVSVPAGPWYCEKCLSQENSKVKCELCPMREGAVKHADNGGWAHVVCALYIPEVRFGNVTTMDPIILSGVPTDRYSKTCYICEERGFKDKASEGACMQCNKLNCKSAFHVTCAQSEGLLCEESGQLDNIKYCGYCSHHFKKLKKDPNIKAVPPYKPSRSFISGGNLSSKAYNAASSNHSSNANTTTTTTTTSKDVSNRIVSTKNCRTSPAHNGGMPGINARPIDNVKLPSVVVGANNFQTQNFLPSVVAPDAGANAASSSASSTMSYDLLGITAKSTPCVANHNGPSSTSLTSSSSSISSSSAAGFNSTSTSSNALAALTTLNASVAGDITPGMGSHYNDLRYPSGFLNTFVPTTIAASSASVSNCHGNSSSSSIVTTSLTSVSSVTPTTTSTHRTKNNSLSVAAPSTKSTPAFADPVHRESPLPKHSSSKSSKKEQQQQADGNGASTTTSVAGHKRRSSAMSAEYKTAAAAAAAAASQSGSVVVDPNATANVIFGKDGKIKKPRRSKKFESLLNLVSPVVEDTVSSFQREKLASQRTLIENTVNLGNNVSSTLNASMPSVSAVGLMEKKLPSSTVSVELSDANYLTSVCNLIGPSRSSLRNSMESHSSAFPTSLEQLLERQWEQGSQFLMEQAQHFDIASLLSCLHQLKIENQRLEDHIVGLIARRDHLLAVNARLSLPLGQQHTSPHSPRVNAAVPVMQQASTSHDYSLESSASANSALSRVTAAVVSNSTMPSALNSSSKSFQTMGNVAVVSPPSTSSRVGVNNFANLQSSAYAALLGGSSSSSGGVGGSFSGVKHKVPSATSSSSQDLSPDRQQQQQQGPFVMPQIPTPQLAAAEHIVRSHTPLLPPQFSLTQDPHQQLMFQIMQHQAAAYNNAISGLIQPPSPHRTAAAVAALSQSHLMQQQTPPSTTQSKS